MTVAVASDSAHTGSAANGKSTRDSLPNAGAADGLNTAARNARRALGAAIDSGAWQRIKTARLGTAIGTTGGMGIIRITITITECE